MAAVGLDECEMEYLHSLDYVDVFYCCNVHTMYCTMYSKPELMGLIEITLNGVVQPGKRIRMYERFTDCLVQNTNRTTDMI